MHYGQRVWSGDRTVIAESIDRYERDPAGQLLSHASDMYSFRWVPDCAERLRSLRDPLTWLTSVLYEAVTSEKERRERAEIADMTSTFFEWMSHDPEFDLSEQSDLRKEAYEVCLLGLSFARPEQDPAHVHSYHLLALRAAKILLDRYDNDDDRKARNLLDEVQEVASKASDPNQKARVFRLLGMLYREACFPFISPRWWRGMRSSIRAITVPGIPANVRWKSMAALLPPWILEFAGYRL